MTLSVEARCAGQHLVWRDVQASPYLASSPASGAAALIGCLVPRGWQLASEPYKRVLTNVTAMSPTPAVCFVLTRMAPHLRPGHPKAVPTAPHF